MRLSKVKCVVAGVVGLSAMGVAGEAFAAGFQLREQSAEYLGNAFAGSAASASSPATVWYNPAGMTLLHGHQIAGTLSWIAPKASFTGSGTRPFGGLSTGSKNGGDAIDDAMVGSTFAMYDFSNDLKFGVAVVSPFGLRSSYSADWTGRYQGLASAVTAINVNPNVAYRVNSNLSIGGGVQVQWFEADLTGAMDQAAICYAQTGNAALCSAGYAGKDGWLRVKGSNIGFGYNFGLLYEFSPQTRVGLTYRSAIRYDLKGDVTTTGALASLYRPNGAIHADFTSPATATASVYHEIDDKWAVMADAQWTQWSAFKDLNVYYDSTGALVTGTHEGWRDTWFFSLGANYKWTKGHTIHVGAAYDMSAVKTADLRTPRIPESDRYWLSAGYTWEFSEKLRFTAAYAHLFAPEVSVADATASGGTLTGKYNGSADIFSTSFVYKF
ncbi:MAG: outer membrane protein transport protein [Hyphomicrobiales bacterium]|nr:outer membrane protein transport protein [Hyphomicrobiales bacterium]